MRKNTKIAIVVSSVAVALVVIVCLAIGFGLYFLIASQYSDGATVDGFFLAYSKFRGDAFVGCYSYVDGEMSLTVPDEYCGYKVTHLGGYYGTGLPCPFAVALPAEYNGFTCLYYSDSGLDGIETETLCFTVYLGENISDIKNVSDICYYAYGEPADNDGEAQETVLKFYRVELYFVVAENNQYFYSVDGILYCKSDGSPAI